ncbi:YbjN domain-containing protein [Coleofasciculus sp. E2-BRE-01]|uniref:YbjN domain-containing protein n=1 Tax=Coleofasciculus sp. E2-BRE-01 TaxID=3069524 RepID=UPI0032F23DBB
MEVKTEHYQLNKEVTLNKPSNSPLTVTNPLVFLTQLNNELIECRLTFQVNPELYQRIETERLFNLTPEMRSPLEALEFLPEPDIKLETTLKPDWLSHLTEHAANVDEAATYILNLTQEQPDSPLLSTDNWLLLSAKQPQESGERGYRTLWDYISPTLLAQAATSDSNDAISDALITFFQDWTGGNLSAMTEKATSQMLEASTNFLKKLDDFNLDKLVQELEAAFKATPINKSIFEQIANFFTADDWTYTKIQGEPTLHLAFQGKNGTWTCYAKAREEEQQVVFYSICPIKAPKTKRRALGEFIARANYGMIIGNFELDFTDGEIRYKTSVDVEGSTLTFALIKRLVYTNIMMMDEYLPGITSVIKGDASPEDAIAQIETQTD